MSAFTWALVTACIWGVVPLMEKIGLGGTTSPAAGVMVRSLGVVVGFLVFGWVAAPWQDMRAMSWHSMVCLACAGLLASFLGQMAFYHALRSGAISQVTPVAGIYPLVAALLGWIVLREPLTLTRALGVMCVVLGAMLLRR